MPLTFTKLDIKKQMHDRLSKLEGSLAKAPSEAWGKAQKSSCVKALEAEIDRQMAIYNREEKAYADALKAWHQAGKDISKRVIEATSGLEATWSDSVLKTLDSDERTSAIPLGSSPMGPS